MNKPLPPVEDLPVLPDLRKGMDADLAATEDGRVFVFYAKPMAEDTDYVIYDLDNNRLQFIGTTGRIQDIGMKVHEPMREYMQHGKTIYLVQVENGQATAFKQVTMLISTYI